MCENNNIIYNKIKTIIDNIPDKDEYRNIIQKFNIELENLCYRHPNELNNMNSCAGERLRHLVNKNFPEKNDMFEWYKTIRKTIE